MRWIRIPGLILLLAATTAMAGPRYTVQVDGLACPFCAYGLEKRLRQVEGVKDVRIELEAGQAVIDMADGKELSADVARQAVEDAGFAMRGFKQVQQ